MLHAYVRLKHQGQGNEEWRTTIHTIIGQVWWWTEGRKFPSTTHWQIRYWNSWVVRAPCAGNISMLTAIHRILWLVPPIQFFQVPTRNAQMQMENFSGTKELNLFIKFSDDFSAWNVKFPHAFTARNLWKWTRSLSHVFLSLYILNKF